MPQVNLSELGIEVILVNIGDKLPLNDLKALEETQLTQAESDYLDSAEKAKRYAERGLS